MPCCGIYDRKYAELHSDRTCGATTTKALWEKGPKCDCCSSYKQWKNCHPDLASTLQVCYKTWQFFQNNNNNVQQVLADKPLYYEALPSEEVTVSIGGKDTTYIGTIRALRGGPLGACQKKASSGGAHPYVCQACDALIHGKTSNINRKLNRSKQLIYPRGNEKRAVKSGVNHKFCSAEHLQVAIQSRKIQEHMTNEKLSRQNQMLHDSWHGNQTARPFVETFINLLETNKLSEFDLSFLSTWLGKKEKGRFFKADDQARRLAILFSNKLGEKMYTTTAPLLGLPSARQAQKIRAKDLSHQHYLPGINKWPLEMIAKRPAVKPLQNGMDGTRIIWTLDLYLDKYIVGQQFSPDVRLYPKHPPEIPVNLKELNDFVLHV